MASSRGAARRPPCKRKEQIGKQCHRQAPVGVHQALPFARLHGAAGHGAHGGHPAAAGQGPAAAARQGLQEQGRIFPVVDPGHPDLDFRPARHRHLRHRLPQQLGHQPGAQRHPRATVRPPAAPAGGALPGRVDRQDHQHRDQRRAPGGRHDQLGLHRLRARRAGRDRPARHAAVPELEADPGRRRRHAAHRRHRAHHHQAPAPDAPRKPARHGRDDASGRGSRARAPGDPRVLGRALRAPAFRHPQRGAARLFPAQYRRLRRHHADHPGRHRHDPVAGGRAGDPRQHDGRRIHPVRDDDADAAHAPEIAGRGQRPDAARDRRRRNRVRDDRFAGRGRHGHARTEQGRRPPGVRATSPSIIRIPRTRPCRTSRSTSSRARRWRWSASRAAANPLS